MEISSSSSSFFQFNFILFCVSIDNDEHQQTDGQ